MTTVTVITNRGIGERRGDPNGMLTWITRHLTGPQFRIIENEDWTAEFGPVPNPRGTAYDRTRKKAAEWLAERIKDHDPATGPLVGLGFSGGAHLLGDALKMLTWTERKKMTRAIMVADPAMPASIRPDQIVGGRRPNSWGITGSRNIWAPANSPMLTWVAHQSDVICCTPALSPLRTIADQLTSLSLNDLGGWRLDLQAKLVAGTFQATDRSITALPGAIDDLRGYTRRGDHVRHYPPLLELFGSTLRQELVG